MTDTTHETLWTSPPELGPTLKKSTLAIRDGAQSTLDPYDLFEGRMHDALHNWAIQHVEHEADRRAKGLKLRKKHDWLYELVDTTTDTVLEANVQKDRGVHKGYRLKHEGPDALWISEPTQARFIQDYAKERMSHDVKQTLADALERMAPDTTFDEMWPIVLEVIEEQGQVEQLASYRSWERIRERLKQSLRATYTNEMLMGTGDWFTWISLDTSGTWTVAYAQVIGASREGTALVVYLEAAPHVPHEEVKRRIHIARSALEPWLRRAAYLERNKSEKLVVAERALRNTHGVEIGTLSGVPDVYAPGVDEIDGFAGKFETHVDPGGFGSPSPYARPLKALWAAYGYDIPSDVQRTDLQIALRDRLQSAIRGWKDKQVTWANATKDAIDGGCNGQS